MDVTCKRSFKSGQHSRVQINEHCSIWVGLVGACLVAIMHTSESPLAAVVPIPMFGRTEKFFFFLPKGFWQQSDINLCKSCDTLCDHFATNFVTNSATTLQQLCDNSAATSRQLCDKLCDNFVCDDFATVWRA